MYRTFATLPLLFIVAACLGCAEEKKVTFPEKISSPPGTAAQQAEKQQESPETSP